MHHHWVECHVPRRGERVRIVDAPAAVGLRIGQHHDVLVRNAGEAFVHQAHVGRSEIAVGIEGGEMRAESRLLPRALLRHAHAALSRGQCNGHEVETVFQLTERLMRENGIYRRLRSGIELLAFCLRVAFCHYRHVYLLLRPPAFQQVAVGRRGVLRLFDKDILRVNVVRERCKPFALQRVQFHGQRGCAQGHRHEKHVFKRAVHPCGFLRAQPFLEERRKRRAVEHAPRGLIGKRQPPVTV